MKYLSQFCKAKKSKLYQIKLKVISVNRSQLTTRKNSKKKDRKHSFSKTKQKEMKKEKKKDRKKERKQRSIVHELFGSFLKEKVFFDD